MSSIITLYKNSTSLSFSTCFIFLHITYFYLGYYVIVCQFIFYFFTRIYALSEKVYGVYIYIYIYPGLEQCLTPIVDAP